MNNRQIYEDMCEALIVSNTELVNGYSAEIIADILDLLNNWSTNTHWYHIADKTVIRDIWNLFRNKGNRLQPILSLVSRFKMAVNDWDGVVELLANSIYPYQSNSTIVDQEMLARLIPRKELTDILYQNDWLVWIICQCLNIRYITNLVESIPVQAKPSKKKAVNNNVS
ncbi:hypothetical protein FOPPYZMZ_CDS0253 [Pseudomonas phage 9Ps-7B]|uniref:Uncharacterized protein n=2 Tax=Viruses TaxID=10239 RepID=A0AAE7S6U9_9CAUD|nr:hypothetical protein [Pseudomonas phage PA7]WAX23705.1 hypothetical protein [Pseudomonas phage pPA-N1803-4At.2]WNV49771.1 hypothetical protein [Pseudomonas phage ANB1]WRQ05688.1 hypothetical protein IPCDMZAV_CDS0165 [Pseudomonas phage 6B]WRQ06185.1 hypothetical protein QAMIJHJT_CDS0254 [Pseudomonas phage 9-Ps-8B]WRQ06593.1 hypothetical protein FOPPYZMZ_CDS0253 [Pseudomonas phage 9Ps-7B]WRQ06944.1 hypothetical protein ZBUARNPM_CDS0195 [Pseudomonas phage 14Ps5-6]BDR26944.1 hypothetical prot